MNKVQVLVEGYVKGDGDRVQSTIALVQGDDVNIVTDPGMVADRAEIMKALYQEDLTLDDITHVFLTHHHPDNTLHMGIFPNAEIVDFWARYKGDLWQDIEDNYEIAPAIRVVRTPGHTEEDATLLVETKEGVYAITHLWWHSDMTPEQDPLAWNQEVLEESRMKVLKLADWIIPSHGKKTKNERE